MTSIAQILLFVLDIVWWLLIVHIIMSWLINFQVLNMRQPLVAQIWYGINKLLEPIYRPLRRIIPPMGGLDITPIVVFIGIYALRVLVINNLYY
jgi:YggT family protein